MRWIRVGIVLMSLPFASVVYPGMAQQNSVLEQGPPRDDAVEAAPMPPDDEIISTPLAPLVAPLDTGVGSTGEDLVPNPLQDPYSRRIPGAAAGPRRSGPAQGQPQQGQPQRGNWIPMATATLQALDKINARGETLTMKVGESVRFGSLNIAVRGCLVRAADRPADAAALLIVRDQQGETPVFAGWMVRSAPYMSMMAHPIYDVRVAGCSQ